MKIQVTATYKVSEIDGRFAALDDTGLILCDADNLEELVMELQMMIADGMLDPQRLETQIINVIGDAS